MEPAKVTEIEEDTVPKEGNVTWVIWTWFGFSRSDMEQTNVLSKVFKKWKQKEAAQQIFSSKDTRQSRSNVWGVSLQALDPTPQTQLPQIIAEWSCSFFLHRTVLCEESGQRCEDITNVVASYLGKDMLPMHSADKLGFKKPLKLKTSDPEFELLGGKFSVDIALPYQYSFIQVILNYKCFNAVPMMQVFFLSRNTSADAQS